MADGTTLVDSALTASNERGIAKRPVVGTPTALGQPSMTEYDSDSDRSDVECPTCGRADFKNAHGMRIHHVQSHGESIATAEKECAVCGDMFEYHPSKSEGPRRCCSKKCMGEWRSEEFSGENHPQYRGGKVELECGHCGSSYSVWPAEAEESQYCSEECHRTAHNPTWLHGKDHWAWKGGLRHGYGKGWTPEKRRAVRERDGHRCQGCGMDSTEHKQQYGRALSVHHKTPARQFDDPEDANTMENLAALCMACHRKAERMAPLFPFAD